MDSVKIIWKRWLSLVLALVMLIGLMPMQAFAAGETADGQHAFKGKKVSILSHSMSTYAGVSNNSASNSTIGSNDVYYTEGKLGVYRNDTWWQQTIDALGMELLVNNSWSGSCVFMPRKGEASVGYGDRAVNLHNDRTGEEPDVIFVYLGCNDFAYYKDTFGKAEDVDYAALIQDNGDGTYTYAAPTTTCEAYAIMLHKVEHRYPEAEVYCITSTARRDPDYADNYADTGQPTEYSAQLHQVAAYFDFPIVDLEDCIPKEAEEFDKYIGDKRAHCNALGMDMITNEVLSVMLGKNSEIRHVTSADGTVAEQAVLLGGSYSAEVALQEGTSVVVTMGGQDVTEDVYADGVITIETVTGDIAIHSEVCRDPMAFRWETQNDSLVSVGDDNPLTHLSGSITDGTFSEVRYQLGTAVVLKHDLPWELEWRCTGDWRGIMLSSDPAQQTTGMIYLSRTKGGQLCFGTWTGSRYDNYGVDLSSLDSQMHTWRLENRIADDGSNMIWLYLDGEEIGSMNNYYIGSKDQSTTSDWVSGKDFVFGYLGAEGHPINSSALEYIQIQEAVHTHTYTSTVTPPTCTAGGYTTYTCDCGDSYADSYVDAIGHSYEGLTCAVCGAEYPHSSAWPKVNTDLTHIVCYGQSFSNGSDAPIYADPAVDGVYVLGSITSSSGDSLIPIPPTGNQHPIISAVNSLAQLLAAAGVDTDIIAGSYGTGGRTIAQLMSAERQAQIKEEEGYTYDINSSGRYAVFQSSVSAVADYAEAKGQTVSCPAIVYLQGETDQNTDEQLGYPDNPIRAGYGAGGDKEKYKLYMTRLKEDMQREVMEAYGQTEKPLFLIYQVSGTYTRTQYSSINMAQLEFAQENEDVILVQTPYFAPHYTSSHHLTVNGYRWLGEYIGNSLYTALVEQEKKWPMLPSGFTVLSANALSIAVSGAENGLSIDTHTVENATSSQNLYGFYLSVDGVNVVPQRVELDANEIILHLPAAVDLTTADSVYVYYAGKNAKGTGNIRDNCTKVGFYSYLDDSADTGTGNNQGVSHSALDAAGNSIVGQKYPMYNWLASFCYEIEVPDTAPKQPAFYHWEMQESGMAVVSEDQNALTLLQGSVESGILKNVQYGMEKTVVLRHNLPWAIEWQAAGNGSSYGGGMLLAASEGSGSRVGALYMPADSRGFIAWNVSGEGKNYGIQLKNSGIDTRQEHIYRIENRIAADGSNALYLLVDGAEIGDMNTAYSTSNGSQLDDTANWADGTDIYLGYLGMPTNFLLNNLKLSYLKIWEDTHTHTYENGICTTCDAEHPNLANYEGKVISILSASTSTFAGYIPVADGFNLAHRARYPQDNLLTDVNETWWMQLINTLDAKLGINDSWAGSRVLNTLDKNSGDLGPDAAMASMTRIQNLGANGDPDLILFFGAGNDMGGGVPLGSFDPATAPSQVDLTATKWETLADAYVAAIMRLQHTYPDAQIVAMATYAMPSYVTEAKLNKYGPVMKAICDHYGVPYVDLRGCGVTFDMLPDKIHPNAEGMDCITEAMLNKLLDDIPMDSGENVVYTVKHELTNAKASLHYYKGVSHGATFNEILSGDNLTVTVTMGGEDITDRCYSDRRIRIENVSGDLVITAKAAFGADGHLQQLPEKICAGTNLWKALEPENIYYTASGWGNTASGNSWSVTFPVQPGDRIWATSLGAYPDNGSSANGVRVTWFDENGVLATLDRNTVYSEFAKNGYITAPDGAVALNVPMTDNQEHYAVYLLSAEHTYEAVATPPTCTEQGYTTYTCECGESYVDSYVDARGYDWMLEDGEFNILLIGNSFSEDASNAGMPNSQMLDILQAMLGEDVKVTVGLLYSGGKGLNWHATQSEQGNSSYSLRVISSESGKWTSYGSYTSANGLIWTDWDVISLQHYEINTTTGKESNAYPDQVDPKFDQLKPATEFMLDYVAEYAPNAAVYFYMHWARAYKPNLNESLSTYNKMAAFFPEVLDYAGTESANRFETIIPVGLSVQNARTTYLSSLSYHTEQGTTINLVNDPQIGLQRDGGHLTYNVGRYIAALTFAEMIIPDELRSEGYTLPNIRVTESVGKLPDEYTKLAQLAVAAAVDNWKNRGSLEVTTIAGYEEDPTAAEAVRLAAVELDIPCAADADDLKSRILAAAGAVVSKDFAVDALTLPDDFALTGAAQQTTATLTVRFGYTSVSVDVAVNVGDHHYESVAVPPTCTEQGFTTYTCSICGDSYVDSYVDAAGHDWTDWETIIEPLWEEQGIKARTCTICGNREETDIPALIEAYPDILHGHLQQLPEDVYAHTNLWTLLQPENGYFYAGTHWGALDDVVSVTIPISAGDQIYASSFTQGIRVTFFDADGVLISLSNTEIKAEFERNGYITVPEGAIAVNIPMWDNSADNVLKILTLEKANCQAHTFAPWVTVVEPGLISKGSAVHDCENCGYSETKEVSELMLPGSFAYQNSDTSIALPYRIYYPSSYESDASAKYPLVIFYHGSGSRGTNNQSQVLGKAMIDRLVALDNCIVVAPQCDVDYQWVNTPWGNGSYDSDLLQRSIFLDASISLLDEIIITKKVDSNRVYVTGQSMGGYAAWKVIMEYPEKFAASVPVCGAADPSKANDVLGVSIWAFHGTDDTTVPVAGSREMIDAIRTLGGIDVRYTEYEGVGHSSWENAFAEPELTDWLFSQERHVHSHAATVTPPTCTERGYTTYTCTACGNSYVDSYVDAKGHKEEVLPAVSATCTATGLTKGKKCSVCGEILVAQTVTEKLGHKEETIPAVAATCTATGLTEGKKCNVCGEILVAQTVTEKLSHKEIIDAAVAATCKTTGLTEGKHCSVCNAVLVAQEVTDKLPHTEETIPAVAATCTATGLTEGKKCSVCGEILVAQTVTEKLGHKEITDPAVDATCTASGLTEGKHCEVCGTTLVAQTVVPALGHTPETIPAVAPTCTEAGLTDGEICGVCGIVTKEQTAVPATGHLWSDGTCGSCGKVCDHDYSAENGGCTVCGDKCAHAYETVVTKPTCTEQGFTSYRCSICGNTYNGDYVEALGHDWTAATCTAPKTCSVCGITEGQPNGHNHETVVTAPTCTEKGYTTHTCHCGDTFKDSYTNALGHTDGALVEENRVDATCTVAGSYETVVDCIVCGAELSREKQEIPAKGHRMGQWKVTAEATCTENGKRERVCENCSHAEEEAIPATGHDHKAAVTEPTCTEQGYTTHICSVCGDSFKDSYTPALTHSMGDWVTVDATCTENGSKTRTCIRCDYSETEVIPATGHSYSYAVAAAPTETAEGSLTGKCHCGDTVTKKLPKLSEADYTYSVIKEPTVEENGSAKYVWNTTEFGIFTFEVTLPKLPSPILLGDVNDDGKISILDLMRLANHFAKNAEINEANSDVNADGKISILDLMRLANYFAGKAQLGA